MTTRDPLDALWEAYLRTHTPDPGRPSRPDDPEEIRARLAAPAVAELTPEQYDLVRARVERDEALHALDHVKAELERVTAERDRLRDALRHAAETTPDRRGDAGR